MDKTKEVIKILSNPSLNDFGKGHRIVDIVRRMEKELEHRKNHIDKLYENLKSKTEEIEGLERLILPKTKSTDNLLKNE